MTLVTEAPKRVNTACWTSRDHSPLALRWARRPTVYGSREEWLTLKIHLQLKIPVPSTRTLWANISRVSLYTPSPCQQIDGSVFTMTCCHFLERALGKSDFILISMDKEWKPGLKTKHIKHFHIKQWSIPPKGRDNLRVPCWIQVDKNTMRTARGSESLDHTWRQVFDTLCGARMPWLESPVLHWTSSPLSYIKLGDYNCAHCLRLVEN